MILRKLSINLVECIGKYKHQALEFDGKNMMLLVDKVACKIVN